MRLAIVLLAFVALSAHASGGRVAAHAPPRMSGPGPAHVHPGFHPSHVHGSVVVGAAFVGLGYWPGYYYPPAYYAAPPVYYAPPPPPPTAYWYYCPQAGAYYPYTPSCPGPWQLVAPTPYTY
jgi:hypothetical protein